MGCCNSVADRVVATPAPAPTAPTGTSRSRSPSAGSSATAAVPPVAHRAASVDNRNAAPPRARASVRDIGRGRVQVDYPSGDTYHGELRRGLRNGRGTYRWTSGASYEGSWYDDDMHGMGLYRYPDGRQYQGAHLHDKAHGFGRFTYADGSFFEGHFANDKIRRGSFWPVVGPATAIDVSHNPIEPMVPYQMVAGGTAQQHGGRARHAPIVSPPPPLPVTATERRNYVAPSADEIEVQAQNFGLTRQESIELASACVVCLAAARTHALVPCGHLCVCRDCVASLSKMKGCPMCRAAVSAAIELKISSADRSCANCGKANGRTHAARPCGHLAICGDCAAEKPTAACPTCRSAVQRWQRIYMLPETSSIRGPGEL